MDELVKDFLQESTENLDRLDQEFVHLESDPGNAELLGSIFRTIHTIKGSCGFLGFTKLEKLTHAGESLLSQMRAGELVLNSEIADHLLEMVDAVRALLAEIRTTESEGYARLSRSRRTPEKTSRHRSASRSHCRSSSACGDYLRLPPPSTLLAIAEKKSEAAPQKANSADAAPTPSKGCPRQKNR